jgi:hypothetical protein
MILFAGDNADITQNWKLASNRGFDGAPAGAPGSHRSKMTGLAQYSGRGDDEGVGPVGTVIVSSRGAVRLLRNDRVTLNADNDIAIGVDNDGDGLGEDLETLLQTCDNVRMRSASGLDCRLQPACGSTDARVCQAALRDSDRDGLTDPTELYGVPPLGNATDTEQRFPQYGADPARYDVFVEVDHVGVDAQGRFVGERGPVDECDAPPLTTAAAWMDQARVYQQMSTIENRDGSTGIFMHFDVGPGPRPTDKFETRFGNWGGSDPKVCSRDRQVAPNRQWSFRSIALMGSAGQKKGALHSEAGLHAVAHELGHQAELDHQGPNSRAGMFNKNPIYLSRMNYGYQDSNQVGFGMADPPVEFNPRRMSEVCPFGPGFNASSLWGGRVLDRDLEFVGPRILNTFPVAGGERCWSIDWDHSGTIDDQPVAAVVADEAELARMHVTGGKLHYRGGADLAVAGDELVRAMIRPTAVGSSFEPRLEVRINRQLSCNVCPTASGPLYPPCWTPNDEVEVTLLRPGGTAPRAASSVAAEGLRFADGWAAVLVYRVGGPLAYSVVRSTGSLGTGSVLREPLQATRIDEFQLGLARLNDTTLLLAYRTQDNGAVHFQRGTVSGPHGLSWSPPEPALTDAETALRTAPDTSPELARTWGMYGPDL